MSKYISTYILLVLYICIIIRRAVPWYIYKCKYIPAELAQRSQAACMSPEPGRRTAGSGRRHRAPHDHQTCDT